MDPLFALSAFLSPAPLILTGTETHERNEGITTVFNVRLKPVDYSNMPHQANYSNVAVVQGIAYPDFDYIELVAFGAVAKAAKDGQAVPNAIEGHLVARVAMGVDVLARLH